MEHQEFSRDPEVFFSICIYGCRVGCAFYDDQSCVLRYVPEFEYDLEKKKLKQVLHEINPSIIICPEEMTKILEAIAAEDAGSPQALSAFRDRRIRTLPRSNFSRNVCLECLTSTKLSFLPETMNKTESNAFLCSLFPTDSQQIIRAIGGLLSYLKNCSQYTSFEASGCIFGIFDIQLHNSEDAIFVDPCFFSNLQILPVDHQVDGAWKRRPLLPRSVKETYVYNLFDHCQTYLGKCIISQWIRNPIQNLAIIRHRLDAVEHLVKPSNINVLETIRSTLSYVGNLPRIFRRMQQSAALPTDWKILLQTFHSLEELIRICSPHEAKLYPVQQLKKENINLGILNDAQTWIIRIVDLEATNRQHRFAVKSGLDEKLDEWVQIYRCLPELLSQLAEDELKKLRENISTCGLIYFPLVGYLLKVPRTEVETPDIELCGLEYAFSHSDMAYYRNITTRELDRRYGDMVYSIIDSETTIMHRLQNELLLHSKDLLRIHQLSAEMDGLCAYAQAAVTMNGTRPEFADDPQIRITEGWHPMHQLKSNHAVRNSFHSGDDLRLTIVTGPNASGKSVYLKQIGLIVYLAYVGSFVPAKKATIGPIDAIYTLTCADDQKDSGQSAYMVCLDLASMAVRNATSRSLILLDEYAQCIEKEEVAALTISLTEYLLARECCPHIVLTTHNHEIIRRLRMHPRIGFVTMKTSTIRGIRIYFYEAERGISESSYALDAAGFAGIPRKVLKKAHQNLNKQHARTDSEMDNNENRISDMLVNMRNLATHAITPEMVSLLNCTSHFLLQ